MRADVSPHTRGVPGLFLRPWLHGAVAIALLAAAAALDITRPFDKSWSISYFIPCLYAGWTLRGQLELLLHGAILLTVFLAPMVFHPERIWTGTRIYNRGFGVVVGIVVILLLWERRRHIAALQWHNQDLEAGVRARTVELEGANDLLRREIAQRQKAETDQRRLEEQLRQAQKMEAIGLLAGGVAHDFNNLLTVIIGQCSLLREDVPAESPWQGSIVEIEKASERAVQLTRQLLAFGRKQRLHPGIVNVNQAIHSVEGLLRRLLPENVRLTIDLNPAAQPILADPEQFAQVFLNLASNARDAMPEGGEFRIQTEPVEVSGEEVAGFSDLRPGPHVRLSISDTGRGMDDTTRQHAFEPFFTTKQVGKGTGLGLASVYGIVTQSRGYIDLDSEPGGGTTFTILWPCCPASPGSSAEATPRPAPHLPRASAAVMLVEDDDLVRAFAAMVLRSGGYRVLEARNGKEALTLATERDAPPFDLLITDVIMPEMGGPALVQYLVPLRPALKVLFITGYSRTQTSEELGQHGFILDKPFSARQLLTAVRQVLQDPPAKDSPPAIT